MLDVAAVFIVLLLCVKPLGNYIARVVSNEYHPLRRFLQPVERFIYRVGGVNEGAEMRWTAYALSLLAFNIVGIFLLYTLLLTQHLLPLNPQNMPAVSPDLAFNIAISFITNTNWQSYSGEGTLSYFSQMVGLTVQNFVSASTGIAVAIALFRAIARKQAQHIGNFWVDLTRIVLYVLLPLSLLWSALLVSQGVVQTFDSYVSAVPIEQSTQQIAVGPAASQVSIKQLGSNGGGFFSVNSAHPLENPTPFSNFLETLAILLIPASLIYTFGVMVGDRRQGWALLATVMLMFLPFTSVAIWQESTENPRLAQLNVDHNHGNMEGKEARFTLAASSLWATATTATSNGSTSSAHDSFMPLGGMMPLMLIQIGGVVLGGVGAGMYSIIVFIMITVFIGGLMVGRTPEYLGKKLGPYEIKMASFAIMVPAILTLGGTALAVATEGGRLGVYINDGAQSFSEILYAMSSAANNNGSAFAGMNANSVFYNTLLGIIIFLGRFFVIIPVLALAGSLAARNTVPPSSGTMPTHTPLFCAMLMVTVLLIDVLTYIPALALGPVVEHLHLFSGVAP